MSNIIIPGQNTPGPDSLVYKERYVDGKLHLDPLAKTSETHPRWRPWAVTLLIYPDKHPAKIYDVQYFCRCGNPRDAVAFAEAMFQQWEKKVFAPDWPYPDTEGAARAECIDEGDWKNILKEAQKARVFKYFGDKVNPQCFTYYPNGWPAVWHPYIKALKEKQKRR